MTRNETEDFLIQMGKDLAQAKANLEDVKKKQIELCDWLKKSENVDFSELIEGIEKEVEGIDKQIVILTEKKASIDRVYPCSDEVMNIIADLFNALGIEG